MSPNALAAVVDEICRRVAILPGDVADLVADEVRQVAPLADGAAQRQIIDAARARLQGLGDLHQFVTDPDVDEVLVNGGDEIWVERHGRLQRVGTLTSCSLEQIIERVLAPIGRRVDRSSPIVDARLPDGSRVCAVVEPVAVDGANLSIRRFADRVRPLSDFTDPPGEALCREVIDRRLNVVVSGPTSSGKTSLLAGLVALLDPAERVVILEDTAELPIGNRHCVRLEGRPPSVDGPAPIVVADLVRTALRLRPDRLVIGEIRGDEVIGMVQAMNTGHDGSFSTCHANGVTDALLRLESLVLQAAPTWPLAAVRRQLQRSIDVVIHVGRSRDGRRRITSVGEVHDGVTAADDSPPVRPVATLCGANLDVHGELTRDRR